MLKVGIGKSTARSPASAGQEAARQACESLGQRPEFILVFATAGYVQSELLGVIREVTGNASLSGCSTSGIITRGGSDESSHALAVMAIASERITFDCFQVEGLSADSRGCGLALAKQIRACKREAPKLLLLFADGITGHTSELLKSLDENLEKPIPVIGGTAGELFKMNRTWQYHNGIARSDAASAVLVSGQFQPEFVVSHGCEPIGIEQTVTRAENGWVYEIDGEPAWSVYQQYLEAPNKNVQSISMSDTCYICLAERLPIAAPGYGEYIIRCPLQLDAKQGALFFPGNIQTGAKVRMALRSAERILAQTNESAHSLMATHPGVSPLLIFHVDCCCSGRMLFGAKADEKSLAPLQALFEKEVPWFGFGSYGEIAPLRLGGNCFHNYSSVLCAFYPEQEK